MSKEVLLVGVDGLIENHRATDDSWHPRALGKVVVESVPNGKTDLLLVVDLRREEEGGDHHDCQNYALRRLTKKHSEGPRRTGSQGK